MGPATRVSDRKTIFFVSLRSTIFTNLHIFLSADETSISGANHIFSPRNVKIARTLKLMNDFFCLAASLGETCFFLDRLK